MRRNAAACLFAAVALAIAIWWLVTPGAGVPFEAPEMAAPPPTEVVAAERHAATAETSSTDDAVRRALPVGDGELEMFARLATGSPTTCVLRVVALDGDASAVLSIDPSARAHATLPAGEYRVDIMRSAGDSAIATTSAFWVADPPSDRVRVRAGQTTSHVVFLSERSDAPPRGTGVIRGIARLDGEFAADLVVRTDGASGGKTTHVGSDGVFVLDDVPAGLVRIELCSRMLPSGDGRARTLPTRDGREALLVYVAADVAPLAGGIAEVTLDARTCAVHGTVQAADGSVFVRVEGGAITGFAFANTVLQSLRVEVGADGRFGPVRLPAGTYRFAATGARAGSVPMTVTLEPDQAEASVDLQVIAFAAVSGTVVTDTLPQDRAADGWMAVRFVGPMSVDVQCRQDRFDTALLPGSYAVEFLGRAWGHGTATPVEITADGPNTLELRPVRRRR